MLKFNFYKGQLPLLIAEIKRDIYRRKIQHPPHNNWKSSDNQTFIPSEQYLEKSTGILNILVPLYMEKRYSRLGLCPTKTHTKNNVRIGVIWYVSRPSPTKIRHFHLRQKFIQPNISVHTRTYKKTWPEKKMIGFKTFIYMDNFKYEI